MFLTYATQSGRTFLDRELYLPRAWTEDSDRCAAAGIPEERGFATKPELAATMLERAVAAHVPAAWVTADTVYGQAWAFRRAVEETGLHYVLGVPASQAVWPKAGPLAWHQVRAKELIASLPGQAWRVRASGAISRRVWTPSCRAAASHAVRRAAYWPFSACAMCRWTVRA